jgi:hypothetical protein
VPFLPLRPTGQQILSYDLNCSASLCSRNFLATAHRQQDSIAAKEPNPVLSAALDDVNVGPFAVLHDVDADRESIDDDDGRYPEQYNLGR